MFDVEICFEDIMLSSIDKEDLPQIEEWMKDQAAESAEAGLTNVNELQDRFLEYYMSENEIFLKIQKGEELIGIFKGRVEFKSLNEVLIWCFIIDSSSRGVGIGSRILREVTDHFENNLGIYMFSTAVIDGSMKALKFWKNNGFAFHRVSKSFFNIKGEEKDMIILKKESVKKVI